MGVLYWLVAALYCNAVLAEVVYYDSYSTAVLTEEEVATYDTQGNKYWCVNAFETCSETEGRRFDGSCNNLKYPYAGAGHSKFERLLPAYNSLVDGFSEYLATGDYELPSARAVRTALLPDGEAVGEEFTQLGLLFTAFVSVDFTPMTALDITLNLATLPNCCVAAQASNPMCAPIDVPEDDILIASGITCLNLTRPIDYQYKGCAGSSVVPRERIQYGASHLDMKTVYGSDPQTSLVRQRLFQGGLFNYSAAADGLQWPEYIASTPTDGMANNKGHQYMFAIMFWREHNRIATELSKLNPSWTDDQLFETAREINLAQYTQIFYYEVLSDMFGYDNLVNDGVLMPASGGFRDIYDEDVLPGWWTESLYAYRWFHTIQKSSIERYTVEGEYFDVEKISLTVSSTVMHTGKNMTYLSQGLFRGLGAVVDDKFDEFLGETALGTVASQKAIDLGAIDLQRGRSLGVAPYVEILHLCDGQDYEDFDSLSEYLDEDVIELLQEIYWSTEVVDVEMLAAVWREKNYPGSKVPKTVYCLVVKQLQRNIQSDRHWYERPNRPNAFTEAQLAEIRKITMSRLFCDNIGGITDSGITARTVAPISDDNPIVSCDTIPKVDLNAWAVSS